MVEAYVNGVDGEMPDDLSLVQIGGYRPRNGESARKLRWKIFESGNEKHGETYRAERDYLRLLQARNRERSEWSADEIRQRLQRNVMLAQGELVFDKVFSASYQGQIIIESQRVAEINVPAATQALHLLGKMQGLFRDELVLQQRNPPERVVRPVRYVGVEDEDE